ncbi:MAG: polysaccharide biosynthesis tyrosine autokinase [Balneolaceae bacterium]
MHLNGSNDISSINDSKVNNIDSSDEHEIDLARLLNVLFLNKWTLISFMIIGSSIAAALSLMQIPIYRSSGTIIISESQNRYSYAGSDLSSLLSTTYGIGVGSTIANELQILKSVTMSYELAERIKAIELDKNGDKFPVLWRSYLEDSTTPGIDSVALRLRQNIKFDQVDPGANLVRIVYESPSPEEAAMVVNLAMATYEDLSSEQNRTMAMSALSFLQTEKAKIESTLSLTEDSLETFMSETNLISVSPQSNQIIETLSALEGQRQSINFSLVTINSSILELQNQLQQIKPGLADQFSESVGPIIEKFQFAISELETERILLKTRNPGISEINPELLRIENQINLIKSEIKDLTEELFKSESPLYLSFVNSTGSAITARIAEISENLVKLEIERKQFQIQRETIRSYYNEINDEFEKLPSNIIGLARLERDVKINEELYLLVSSQLAEMSLWEKTQFGLGRTLDSALVPVKPFKPRKKIITIIGFLLGTFLGTGFVLLKNAISDKITSTEALKFFKIPLLGTIPDFSILDGLQSEGRQIIDDRSVSNQLITFLDHISPISEAYRRLRINVVYANPDKAYKVIMVTSATKGEGKSTVAANLAVTFSEAEKTVLIIDLDLRRPTQHKIFGENREPGLTDSLFETIKISDITNATIAPNVDLITVGKKTPEPATVLDSKRLKQLIDKLSERYDHIILDTAPYGIISDSASLLRLVDGIVVVSRFNVTTKKELAFTLEGLQHLNADILGIVLNAFDPKKSTDYYTNYSYYKRTYSDYYQEDKL